MPVIGELATIVSARTKPFEKGMGRARTATKSFVSSVGKATAALAGLAAAAGGIRAVTNQLKEIDEIGKQAARIGTTTEAISRLQFAAELTGAGSARLAKGLDVMQKRLGEAARGSGAAKAALSELGLSASDLIAMDPAQAFTLIAERVSQMDTQAQKAAATANIFSRANQDLVNTLDLGSAGLAQMAAESDRFGNTVDQSTVAQVEAANDAVTRMRASFTGLTRQLAIQVAPALGNLATKLAELNIADKLKAAFFTLRATISQVIAELATKLAQLARMSQSLLETLPGKTAAAAAARAGTVAEFLETFADDLSRRAAQDRRVAQARPTPSASLPTSIAELPEVAAAAVASPNQNFAMLGQMLEGARSFAGNLFQRRQAAMPAMAGAIQAGGPQFAGAIQAGSADAVRRVLGRGQDKQTELQKEMAGGIGQIVENTSAAAQFVFGRIESLL